MIHPFIKEYTFTYEYLRTLKQNIVLTAVEYMYYMYMYIWHLNIYFLINYYCMSYDSVVNTIGLKSFY